MQSEMLLNNLSKEVETIQNDVLNQFEKIPLEILNWKENAESWSIAECLEHLNIYSAYYLPAIEMQINQARKDSENLKREAKSTWFGKFSIKSIDPANVKKQKTLKHLNPSNSQLEANVVKRFQDNQTKLLKLLKEAKSINLNKVKIPVEFFKLVKINAGDCFQFLIAHEKRHIIQATNAKNKALEKERMHQ